MRVIGVVRRRRELRGWMRMVVEGEGKKRYEILGKRKIYDADKV